MLNRKFLKPLFNILLWCIILVAAYFIRRRWLLDSKVGVEGFFLLLVAGVVFTWQIIWLANKAGIIQTKQRDNLLLLAAAFTLILLFTEIGLRVFAHSLQSSFEKDGKAFYLSPYCYYMMKCDSCGGRYEYINRPNTTYNYKRDEFDYVHKYNSYGLRDAEFKVRKDTNEYRIMGLGDSFVEGVGTTADSCWVKQLEHRLNETPGPVRYTTMNAGVHGSDLFFSYELLTRCLMKYKPDMVILNLNSTDVYELMVRGDFGRFDADGNFKRQRGPWWEFAFGSSYLVRLVMLNLFHYDWELLTPAQYKAKTTRSINLISEKLNDYYKLSKEKKFAFLLVLQPIQNEFEGNENFIQRLNINPAIDKIDLTGYIRDTMEATHKPMNYYYWPIDGHFTGVGYCLEADIIYRQYFLNRKP